MKKFMLTLIVVLLGMTGCSQSESMSTDREFSRVDTGLYTQSGEVLLNLDWLNDTGKVNAAVILAQTALTNEGDFTAYILGEEDEVLLLFTNVEENLEWYKNKQDEGSNGEFDLHGQRWKIQDLVVENLTLKMKSEDKYYAFDFIRG